MKLNRHAIAALALLAAAAALTLAGCDNTYGVFHEIQTEKAQVGTDQFKNATVKALGEDDANYYAVMAKVFYRTKAGGTWTVLPVGTAQDTSYYCAGFAFDSSNAIYVAAADSASTATLKGIFTRSNSASSWTRMDSGEFAGKKVDALFYVRDTLFVEAHIDTETSSTYYLYYWTGAAFANAGLSSLSLPIQGMAYGGSKYFAMTNSVIYASASNSGFSASTTSTPGSSKVLCGIASDHSGNVLATTADGELYTWNGAAWSSATVKSGVKLGALAEAPKVPAGASYSLIIPKHDTTYGYYEYDVGAASPRLGSASDAVFVPTSSNYTTAIYNKPALAIYYSASMKTILIALAAQGTDGYALYSNTYSTAWGGWTAE